MKYIHVILSIVALIFVESVSAQDWTVDPADFEFSMNLTGKVSLDDGEIDDENTTLGAFVGGDCVGLCQPTEQSGNFELFLLTVYSNTASGDMIEFKLLTSESIEVSLENQVLFQSNAIVCSAENPFIWMETATYSSTEFLSFSHAQQSGVAEIDLFAKEVNLIVDYQVDLSAFTPEFELSPGAKASVNGDIQVSGESSLDFTSSLIYQVEGVDGSVENWQVSVQLDESAVDLIETIGISVFPNPATEFVKIQIPKAVQIDKITLMDMSNKVVLNAGNCNSDNLLIPLAQLSNGLYVIKFELHDKSVCYYRLLKQ